MAGMPLSNKDYNLISVVYHASQGLETCRHYVSDAEREGDEDTAAFFKEAGEQYEKLVTKGKDLLKQCL